MKMAMPGKTTIQGAAAAVQGIEAMIAGRIGVRSLQDAHAALRKARSEMAAYFPAVPVVVRAPGAAPG